MHLYKYTTANTANLIIRYNKLRWSTPQVLNDPFDMQFAFQFSIDREIAKQMALNKIWDHHYGTPQERPLNKFGRVIRILKDRFPRIEREEFDQIFGTAIDESYEKLEQKMLAFNKWVLSVFADDKILCLSDKPDSILMWSYYALNHSGVALRFDSAVTDSPLSQARRIDYAEKIPSLFNNELFSDMLAGYQVMDADALMSSSVYTKSNLWAHENEWRVYSGKGRTQKSFEDVPFNTRELDGVIFGARTNPEDRMSLATLLKTFYPHVTLYQATTKPNEYGLSIEVANEDGISISLGAKIRLTLEVLADRAPSLLKTRLQRLYDKDPPHSL